jgi:chromosome partitioning protein
MAKIISVCNQKGGTGKTTTSVNLSYALASYGIKVLLVDMDPQGNSTSGVGVNKINLQNTVYEVLLGKADPENSIVKNVFPNLDLMPCNINLTGAEIELVGILSRETRLRKALEKIGNEYDYIFVDSPPSLGLLTLNALVACNSVLIPIQCEFYALEGVSQLLNTINLIRDNLNPKLEIEGVVLTMADFRTNLTHEVIEEINGYFSNKVYSSIIPRNVKLSEAPSFGKPIMLYDPNCLGSEKYKELSIELIGADKYAALVGDEQEKKITTMNKQEKDTGAFSFENEIKPASQEDKHKGDENNCDGNTKTDAWPTVNEVNGEMDETHLELGEEWKWMADEHNVNQAAEEEIGDVEKDLGF